MVTKGGGTNGFESLFNPDLSVKFNNLYSGEYSHI